MKYFSISKDISKKEVFVEIEIFVFERTINQ